MRSRRTDLDLSTVQFKTSINLSIIKETEEACRGITTDHEKEERLSKPECRTCHYIRRSRIGGAAMTQALCSFCGTEMMFSNTCVDVLCPDCAKKHELCKHCGGDLRDRMRRKLERR